MSKIQINVVIGSAVVMLSTFFTSTSSMAQPNTIGQQTQQWAQWPTVGKADLNVLFFDIYTSELRAPQGRYQVGVDITPHPLALSITYERDISKQHLLKETKKQWQHLGYGQDQWQPWARRLGGIYPDVANGEQLVYISDGQGGAFIYIRNDGVTEMRGHIDDEALNDAFLAIWLSPNTEYPKQRKQLIGMAQ
ncbi:hypothetical protein [Vibrio rarus]|uniref:hypothetical protein n=1 Tax=Vibrio rarus TaxID=413403 RepID=UPI0021C25F97|nr:hypothetical protein [Vibrio rarus]